MGEFIKGDVVIVPFPFADLSTTKKRPALVIAALAGDDIILCQTTSKAIKDAYAIYLLDSDFESGTLQQDSNIPIGHVKTLNLDYNIMQYSLCSSRSCLK